MLSFANPTLPEFSDDLLIAPAVVALQGHHGKPNTFSSYTTRRDTAKQNGKTPVARGQLIRCARNESVATRSIAMGQSTQ